MISGCVKSPTVKLIEKINQTLIVQGDQGEINLWSSPSIVESTKVGRIIYPNTRAGTKVTAFEKQTDSKGKDYYYHIRTSTGKEGWVSSVWISEDSICATDEDCKSLLYRDFFCLGGVCIECRTTRDCITSQKCHPESHWCVDCLSNDDCSSVYPICDLKENGCTECLSDGDCSTPNKFCIVDDKYVFANKCVECLDNYDCLEDEWCDSDSKCISR